MKEDESSSSADEIGSKGEVVATGVNVAAGEAEQQIVPPFVDSSDNSACSRPDGALVTATSNPDASIVKASETTLTTITASPVVEEEASAAEISTPITPTTLAASSKVSTSTAPKADDRNSAASPSTTPPAAVPGEALEQEAEVPEQQEAAVINGDVIEERHAEKVAESSVPGAGSPAEASSPSDGLRKALVGFYNVHNPGRIATLDVILKQYVGKEELLIERLEQKYTADLSHARKVAAAAAAAARAAGQIPHPLSPPQPSDRAAPPVSGDTPAQRGGGGVPVLSRPPSSAFTSAHNNTPPRSGGAASQPGGAAYGNGTTSSNYMTYLADQIRSNVEGFLPASSSGGGGGGGPAGGGTSSYPVSYVPFSPTTTTGAERPPAAAGFERAASAGGAGLMRVGSANFSTAAATAGPTISGATTNNNSSYAGGRHHYPQAEPDPSLVARVRGLEEERAALLTACRRMQGKVDAASREAAATEELREAGQRKITSFAERAVAAERKAREVTVRLRTLESGQAGLKAEREASARRCVAKHKQLLSAIDSQLSLRSQLEGLLEVVPPSRRPSASAPASEPVRGLETPLQQEDGGVSATTSTAAAAGADALNAYAETSEMSPANEASPISVSKAQRQSRTDGGKRPGAEGGTDAREESSLKVLPSNGDNSGGDNGEGDVHEDGLDKGGKSEGEGRDVDELKRRCSMLEVSLRASRREALEERRARDAAERTVRQQREALPRLKERVSELEACLEREQEAGKVASHAASGLEAELELRLDHLRKAESDLSEQTHANSRLKEELRVASARLGAASSARASLVDFCRQERTAVEQLAAEQVVRLEESAAARGEQHLAKGLELAKMAEDLGDKRAAGLMMEVDRLGKALFASRARLAGTEAVAQGLRRELERAAETIVGLNKSAIVSSPSPSAIVAAGTGVGSGRGRGGGAEGTASGEAAEAVLAKGAEAGDGEGGDASRERSGGLTEEEALMIRSPSASAAANESGAGDSKGGDGSTAPVAVVKRAGGAGGAGGGGGRKGSIHKLALAAGELTRRAASSKMAARPLSKPVASDGETPPTAAVAAARATTREGVDARGSAKMVNRSQSPRVARQPQKSAAYDVEL